MRCTTFLIALAASSLVSAASLAQCEDLRTAFTYQGRLLDDGNPIDGTVEIGLSLWDSVATGTKIAPLPPDSELLLQVEADDGLFLVDVDFGAAALTGCQLYLQISVEGTTLSPRQPINPSTYSLQTRGISVDAEENVGIGASQTPFGRLQVNQAADTPESGIAVVNSTEQRALRLWVDNANVSRVNSGGTGNAPLALNGTGSGKVGIGRVSPQARLDVAGTVLADNLRDTATPPVGSIHADNVIYAWAEILGDGSLGDSYGIDSATRVATGHYTINYSRSLSGGAAPMVTVLSFNEPTISTAFGGPDSCQVFTKVFTFSGSGNPTFLAHDTSFYIQVVGRP